MSTAAVVKLLCKEGFDSDVCDIFHRNKISADILLELDGQDLNEMGIIALAD